jgi:hypothetical protein
MWRRVIWRVVCDVSKCFIVFMFRVKQCWPNDTTLAFRRPRATATLRSEEPSRSVIWLRTEGLDGEHTLDRLSPRCLWCLFQYRLGRKRQMGDILISILAGHWASEVPLICLTLCFCYVIPPTIYFVLHHPSFFLSKSQGTVSNKLPSHLRRRRLALPSLIRTGVSFYCRKPSPS